MLDGDTIRAASALRTALVGAPLWRFDAPNLIGPTPHAGRLIEHVGSRGRHVEITFDDGIILDTSMRKNACWHVYRHGARWRRSQRELRAAVQTDDWVAVCFNSPTVETYRSPNRDRHPGFGRLGPDLGTPTADLNVAVNLLMSYQDPEARLRDVLLDEHVMRGIGNVYRSEILWEAELSPWAHVGDLTHHDALLVAHSAARFLRTATRGRTIYGHRPPAPKLSVFGRNGQACPRCHDSIECGAMGRHKRNLYWCPTCQVRLDRRRHDDTPAMDPHPAAVKFLSDLPWRRDEFE